jgi:hypothetical protein
MMAPRWREPAEALRRLVAAFGLDAKKLRETRQTVSYHDANFEAAKLRSPTDPALVVEVRHVLLQQALAAAKDQYGPAFTFNLGSDSNDVFLDENGVVDGLWQKIGDSEYLEIGLKIDKETLLKHWNLDSEAYSAALFLDPRALWRRLRQPLMALDKGEEALFPDDRKLVVFVPERNLGLDGNFLAIIGGDALEQWQNRTAPDPAAAQAVNALAREKLNWMSGPLERLTPLHLKVAGPAPQDDDIAATVYAQLLTCCLLYIANRSKSSGTGWEATFDAEASAVKISIPGAEDMLQTAGVSQAAKVIAERTLVIYHDLNDAPDRLTVAQNAIASELEGSDPAAAMVKVIHDAAGVGKRIEYAWEAFIKRKLQIYFGQVKQLVETIEAARKSYQEQVQTLTKTLIDNMLAAVAVILGSFIAAMLKSPFEKYLFWFGAGLYVVYLLFFPIGIGLTSMLQRFRQSRSDFRRSIDHFSKGVPAEQVEAIVGKTVAERECWFLVWWGVITSLYVLVAIGIVVMAIVLPGKIRTWSDAFELKSIAYGRAAAGAVPVTVRGENFAEDKPIVVRLGTATFTNRDGSLAVRGTTALTFAAPVTELSKNKVMTVQQGAAGPAKLTLPPCP